MTKKLPSKVVQFLIYVGGDIGCVDSIASIQACIDSCKETSGCVAIAWVPSWGPTCCLKNTITARNAYDIVISARMDVCDRFCKMPVQNQDSKTTHFSFIFTYPCSQANTLNAPFILNSCKFASLTVVGEERSINF